MSSYNKANRELIKKEKRKLQIEEEKLKEKKRLAELQQNYHQIPYLMIMNPKNCYILQTGKNIAKL